MRSLFMVIMVLGGMGRDGFSAPPKQKVYISKIVEHPALDATEKGILEALKQEGFEEETLEIRVESAQSNPTLAQQIATKYMAQKPDIVVGLGTITAQSFKRQAIAGHIRLVFSSVTDPLKASLVQSLEHPEGNTTGVSNFVDLKPQLELFKKIQPQLKILGILYNPGEINSVLMKEKLEKLCPDLGMILVCQSIYKTTDVAQNAAKLASQVEAIFISNDNTALSSLQGIAKACKMARIPLYVSDVDAVELGAVAALGPNQYDIGLQTGQLIARLLKGGDIAQEKVQFPNKTDLYLNQKAATEIGIELPVDLLNTAAKVVK